MAIMYKAYRIADKRHNLIDGYGAQIYGGRWNSSGRPVIYASLSYASAMLEILAQSNGKMPKNKVYVQIEIDKTIDVYRIDPERYKNWDSKDFEVSRSIGDQWLEDSRTVALIVPSVISQHDSNILINPKHSDFGKIQFSDHRVVKWDDRLFR